MSYSDKVLDHYENPRNVGGFEAADAGGDASEQPFATAVVLPILDRTCVPCHGPEKAKGELRLDSPDALRRGTVRISGNPPPRPSCQCPK